MYLFILLIYLFIFNTKLYIYIHIRLSGRAVVRVSSMFILGCAPGCLWHSWWHPFWLSRWYFQLVWLSAMDPFFLCVWDFALARSTISDPYFAQICLQPIVFFSLAVGGPQPCLKCCKQQLLLLKTLSMVHSFGLIRVLGISWIVFPPPGRRRGFPIDFSFRRQRARTIWQSPCLLGALGHWH